MTRRRKGDSKPGPKPRAGEIADQRLEVKLTRDELAAIDAAAVREQVSRAEWIREAAAAALDLDSIADRAKVRRLIAKLGEIVLELDEAV